MRQSYGNITFCSTHMKIYTRMWSRDRIKIFAVGKFMECWFFAENGDTKWFTVRAALHITLPSSIFLEWEAFGGTICGVVWHTLSRIRARPVRRRVCARGGGEVSFRKRRRKRYQTRKLPPLPFANEGWSYPRFRNEIELASFSFKPAAHKTFHPPPLHLPCSRRVVLQSCNNL